MRIASLPCPGAVGFYRAGAPNSLLRELGHQVIELFQGCNLSQADVEEVISTADLVSVIQPGGSFEDRLECWKEMRGALVLEVDDDPFSAPSEPWFSDPEVQALVRATGARPLDSKALSDFDGWLRGADLVTTTTDALATVLSAHGAREVAVCPNAVFPAFQRSSPRPQDIQIAPGSVLARSVKKHAREAARACPPTRRIGFAGSIHHKHDLGPPALAIRRLISANAEVELYSIGPCDFASDPAWADWKPRSTIALPGQSAGYVRVRSVGPDGKRRHTVDFAQPILDQTGAVRGLAFPYFMALESMAPDVAIAPLRPSPFNACKSDLRLLEWGIQGVPVVASRFGPFTVAEQAGFPAVFVEHEDTDAWEREIGRLLYDRGAARSLGERARAWVLEHRTFPRAGKAWERAYTRALEIAGVELEQLE